MRITSFTRALAAVAVIATLAVTATQSAHATLRPQTLPRAVTPSAAGKSVAVHKIARGLVHHWPPPKVDLGDQGRTYCATCLRVGPLRVMPKQRVTSAQKLSAVAPRSASVSPRLFSLATNTPQAVPNCGCPGEPSEATLSNVVVYSANQVIAFSTNYGATFTPYPMNAFFPDNPAGGPAGDQVVIYIPSINRFAWLVQYFADASGVNLDRLVVFPPTSVTSGGLTGPFNFWDLPSQSGTYHFVDFPDLAVGNHFLYLSTDIGTTKGVVQSEIARIGLSNLQMGLNLAAPPHPWRFWIGAKFLRVAQNTGGTAYWAQPNSTSQMKIWSWPEGSNTVSDHTINTLTWPDKGYPSFNPDGNDWNSTYRGVVLGIAVTPSATGDKLWLSWSAGIGTGSESWLSQPNVQLLKVALPGISFVSQTAIWNPSYAYSFARLSVSESGDLGIIVGVGGHGNLWTNTSVSDWTDTPNQTWQFTASTMSDGGNRWGDYVTIHPLYGRGPLGTQYATNGFSAAGIGIISQPGGPGRLWDLHYVKFFG
jgi:hypothetical protein